MKAQRVTIRIKAIGQYFHVVLFIMLCKVVLTLKSMDNTDKSSNKALNYCKIDDVKNTSFRRSTATSEILESKSFS